MSNQPTESKPLLSHTIAEWACALNYEHLSPAAIQAAKLFWFDSIGCALGGSQQDDAKILLKHYRAMSGGTGTATAHGAVMLEQDLGVILLASAQSAADRIEPK